jgi:ABC-2 type transport system ATP-binding protein
MAMAELAILTEGLTKRFGRKTAVNEVSLHVPRGSIYGFLGRNGAGKTTTIHLLMGLLEVTAGTMSVLGLDPRREGVAMKRRVTFVPETPALYPWMTVAQAVWFASQFYPTWNHSLAADLLRRFELPEDTKIKHLSRGMQGKTALTLALAPEPELLILDDPTSGLDALVRREFMESIIGALQETGATVFFSSHIINDVERVADWVGIIEDGRLVREASLDDLKQSVRRVRLVFEGEAPEIALEGILAREGTGRERVLTLGSFGDGQLAQLQALNPSHLDLLDLSLEDIFVALVRREAPMP